MKRWTAVVCIATLAGCGGPQSKYPPAKPGALERWPLKAAGGVADATPGQVATKVAGQRQRLNFTDIAHLFLVPDTGPSDLFILFNCRYEMPACPEALTNPHLQRMTLSPWIKPGTRETSRFGGIAIILGTFVWSCRTDAGVSSTDNRGLLPEMSNFYCLPGRAGGSPIVLAPVLAI